MISALVAEAFQIFQIPQKPHRSVPCLDSEKLFTKFRGFLISWAMPA